MTIISRIARAQWWCLFLIPIVDLLFEIRSGRVTSADESLLGTLVIYPWIFISGLFGIALLGKALIGSGITPGKRTVFVALAVAVIPCGLLCGALANAFGWSTHFQPVDENTKVLAMAALVVWTVFVLASRKTVRTI